LTPEHSHDYDEIVLYIGADPHTPEYLGGEIEFKVEGLALLFDITTALSVLKGTKHGPLKWKEFTWHQMQLSIVLGGGSLSKAKPGGRK